MPSDKTLEVRPGSLGAMSMRYHELWLQRWFYSRFFVREGYPVPVVFGTPMDAFAHFKNLWADEQNPFKYLLELKDENGTPLYEPHPSPVRYPLISVMRKGQKMRPYQNFSIHRWRHMNWPTISDAGSIVPGKEQVGYDLTKCDLGNVTVSRMPMAWDYRFQIDHFCLRPDTQAFFLEKLANQFWRGGGAAPQTWMDIEYPGYGSHYIRLYVEGEIDQSAPEDSQFAETNVEYRTSFTIVLEGFDVDLNFQNVPALWTSVFNIRFPEDVPALFYPVTIDGRARGYNYVLESRTDIPSAGTCQEEGIRNQYLAAGTVYIELGDLAGTMPGDNVYDPNRDTPGYVTDPIFIHSTYHYGIPSSLVFGTPIFTSGTQEPHWLSGVVSPAVEGAAIEVDGVGTFLTAANGSYFGLLPYNYSGTATPHYALASEFVPPVRVYESVIEDTPDQDYSWVPLNFPPWVSGTVTPGAANIGVEFPAVGTFAVDPATGSYSGTVPYGYSGVALPHYAGAEAFTPPYRVYADQTADIGDQNYAWTPIIHFRGTDSFSLVSDFGNVPEYHIYNYVNDAELESSFFGTHFAATVPSTSGTDAGGLDSSFFGTHVEVTVFADAGTESGTLASSIFGTYTETVEVADAGTSFTSLDSTFFGTATQVIVSTSAGTNFFGTMSSSFFGTYALGS